MMWVMKKYRIALKELMNALGINSSGEAYNKYFVGKITRQNVWLLMNKPPSRVSMKTIDIICDALDIDPSYLFIGTK